MAATTSRKFTIGSGGIITDNTGRKYNADGQLLLRPKGAKTLAIPAGHAVLATAAGRRATENANRVQRNVAKNPAIAVTRTARPVVTAGAIQAAAANGDKYAKMWATRLAKYGPAGAGKFKK